MRSASARTIKAVMLGDFQFYRDTRSAICNLFEVSSSRSASNLTSCRLLSYLHMRAGTAHSEGPGFVELDGCIGVFAELFGETDDVVFHCERLLKRKLIEVDTRSPDSLTGCRALRITRSGTYYLKTLCRRFQYLDLISLDTPIWSHSIRQELTGRADQSDLVVRIERAELLLGYLRAEEQRSLENVPAPAAEACFGPSIVSEIVSHYDRDLSGRVIPNAKLSARKVLLAQEEVRRLVAEATRLTVRPRASDS
jgi:hypothetical protein